MMLTAAIVLSCGHLCGMVRQSEGSQRWALLVSGVSGDADLQGTYLEWIRTMHTSLTGPLQFPQDHVFVLFDDPARDPALVGYKSTRENLEKVARDVASRAGEDDLVFVLLVGHGNYEAGVYKLNLVGPDPTAEDIMAMFHGIRARRFVIANTTTCSGGSIPALARKGWVMVSATKSGNEKNRTHFGRYFVEAFQDNRADTDKDLRVSILEAFTYASKKVEEFYSGEGRLQTEHPVLEDDGDGQAHASPGPDNGEGFLSRTTFLASGPPLIRQGALSQEEQALAGEIQSLGKQIEALKYRKSEMGEAEYEAKLEELLLKLAEVQEKLRKHKPKE